MYYTGVKVRQKQKVAVCACAQWNLLVFFYLVRQCVPGDWLFLRVAFSKRMRRIPILYEESLVNRRLQ